MDVTPIVEILEAMPSDLIASVTVEINLIVNGDLTLLEADSWNAPFGHNFMNINVTDDQSTRNDNSAHVTGVEADSISDAAEQGRKVSKSVGEADEIIAVPKPFFNDSPNLPGVGV